MSKFTEIWGDWKEGPSIIGSIIEHLKDKSIVMYGNEEKNQYVPAVSFPFFIDEIKGERISVQSLIGEFHQPMLMHCLGNLFSERNTDLIAATTSVTAVDQENTLRINSTLAALEKGRRDANSPDEFWKIAADYFGLPEMVESRVNTENKRRLN